MNPEKFFDYLEGNLPAAERAQFEATLAGDPKLQHELDIAREMHTRSRGSREVLGESDTLEAPAASGKLGRRLAAAFGLLVLVNVLVGIAFIIGNKGAGKPTDRLARELAMRQQLEASLQKTAESALPPPTLANEIFLFALANEREAMANNVVLLATQCGGSAAKAPPDDEGITVLADLPATREDEFRSALAPLAQGEFSSPAPRKETPSAEQRINIYVRITQAQQPANP